MRRRILAILIAAALVVSAIGSAGAYWTSTGGASPARCPGWAAAAESGSASAQFYLDRYCVWVDED